MAVALGVLESLVPRPLPFAKPGLANIAAIAALVRSGAPMALRVNVLRTVASALFLGTLATPTFLLSLSGGVASVLAMSLAVRLLSVTGTSVAGSLASMGAQLAVASLLLPGLPAMGIAPFLAAWGTATGAVTGIAAVLLLRRGFPWTGGLDEGYDRG